MDSLIDECGEGARLRGISLTPTMASEGGRLENETEEAVASPRRTSIRPRYGRLEFPYPAAVLYLTYIVLCVTTACSAATGTLETTSKAPLVTQTRAGDGLLLKRVIEALAQSRVAMNPDSKPMATGTGKFGHLFKAPPANGRPVLNEASSNYSKDLLIRMIYQKAVELNKMKGVKSQTTLAPDKSGIPGDPNSERGEVAQHTNNGCPHNDVFMQENDECNAWKAFIFEYLFPWVLILAILGNALTLAVYRSRYLKSAATVLLLAVKAQANLAFVCCLTMEMLHYFVSDESPFQEVYWRSRPYTLFLANYFDSLAVW